MEQTGQVQCLRNGQLGSLIGFGMCYTTSIHDLAVSTIYLPGTCTLFNICSILNGICTKLHSFTGKCQYAVVVQELVVYKNNLWALFTVFSIQCTHWYCTQKSLIKCEWHATLLLFLARTTGPCRWLSGHRPVIRFRSLMLCIHFIAEQQKYPLSMASGGPTPMKECFLFLDLKENTSNVHQWLEWSSFIIPDYVCWATNFSIGLALVNT